MGGAESALLFLCIERPLSAVCDICFAGWRLIIGSGALKVAKFRHSDTKDPGSRGLLGSPVVVKNSILSPEWSSS